MTEAAQTGVSMGGVLLSVESRHLRGALRPLVWVTLEEIALEASWENGRLVARTSARQVADRLRVDPGTVAGALRVLRSVASSRLNVNNGPVVGSAYRSMYSARSADFLLFRRTCRPNHAWRRR
jgi:hypothetical protein